jgi:hypothetical protein
MANRSITCPQDTVLARDSQLAVAAQEEGRSRSKWSRREIIDLTGWPHQSGLINHVAAGQGFGEGQASRSKLADDTGQYHGMGVRLSELPLSPERNPELIPSAKGRQNVLVEDRAIDILGVAEVLESLAPAGAT